MKKHEKEVLQSQLDAEKAVLKQLEKNYQQAIKDIDDKVAALLGRADADMQHVIYQVEYQRQLRTQVQSILEQLQANEFETISEYLTQCYEEGFMGSLYSMQQQGVPLAFPINQKQVVMAVQTDSKISEGLYTRLGKDVSELKKNISAEIARGISTSLPYAQIAKNLNRQAEIGLNRAMRITRTEGGRIQNKAAMDTMTRAKEMGADVVKRWSAALDARTRDSHARIDGEVREIEEKFSNGLMYPKDPSGKASEVVNCRCKVQEKARWALTANQTKMLGNTSDMTDSQKEAIAKRLGIPAEDLDKYSGQIVPINAKNYADFKKQYKEIWNYEGSDLQKEAEARIASYKTKNKSSSKPSRMASAETTNDWSKAVARTVSQEEKSELIRYAADKGINIASMKGFDGDPELLRAEIDAISAAAKKYQLKKPINLNVKVLDNDADFAETHEHNITINAKALRNREVTERNILEDGMFASKTVEDIGLHEIGHVIAFEKGNIGLEITKEAYYNVTGKTMSTKEAIKYLDSISEYATDLPDEEAKKKRIKSNKYTEIIPEVIVANQNAQTEFTAEFVRLLIER